MTHTIGRITIERGTVAHTCPDCMRGLPCQPAPPAPETRTSSLSRVVADAVNGSASASPFMAPVYFGHSRSDEQWKRDTFPQETQ